MAGVLTALSSTGCDRLHRSDRSAAVAAAPETCGPGLPGNIRRIDVIRDRTTVLDAATNAAISHLLLDAAERQGGRWHVALCGGRDAALVRPVVAASLAEPGDEERARWRDSPAARARATRCHRKEKDALAAGLQAALAEVDDGPDACSPLIEAVHATLAGRRPGERAMVVLISDGVEFAPGRSFYRPGSRGLQPPPPDRLIASLQRQDLLPDARGVDVVHVALGWRGAEEGRMWPPGETAALERVWIGLWAAAGARSVTMGRPLPSNGLPA